VHDDIYTNWKIPLKQELHNKEDLHMDNFDEKVLTIGQIILRITVKDIPG
jgi:hypothetical protein